MIMDREPRRLVMNSESYSHRFSANSTTMLKHASALKPSLYSELFSDDIICFLCLVRVEISMKKIKYSYKFR